jgi:hypothetical protein
MPDPVTLFVTSLGSAAGKAGVDQITKALRDIVGLQDAQLRLLSSIDRKVDALLAGPFHTGRQKVEDALAPWRSADDRQHLLREARTFFDVAVNQDPEPLRRSLAALHLAGVWLALSSPQDVRRRLEQAHAHAIEAMLAEKNRKPGGLQGVRGRLSWSVRTVDDSMRWTTAINSVGPYANALARAAQRWGTPAVRAPLFFGGERGLSAEDELDRDAAALDAAERRWVSDGGTLPMALAVLGVPDDLRSRPGNQTALGKVRRGEVLLWKHLAEWNDRSGNRGDLPFWQVLREYQIRPLG